MFSEISLHVLDIAENSISADADFIEIEITVHTNARRIRVRIRDNGCGMEEEQLRACESPFYTTRTTRKAGLGIPLMKHSAECTGGSFAITSAKGQWTELVAEYCTDHADCIPLGDMAATVYSLVRMNKALDFYYQYRVDARQFVFDTRQIRKIIGEIPLDSVEISAFIKDFLRENIQEIDLGKQAVPDCGPAANVTI